MYTLRILKSASRELAQLDNEPARRIVARIRWLAENFEEIKPKVLKGELAGLYKLREGDYRVIYEVIRREKVIVIHSIGHRRDVYRKR